MLFSLIKTTIKETNMLNDDTSARAVPHETVREAVMGKLARLKNVLGPSVLKPVRCKILKLNVFAKISA